MRIKLFLSRWRLHLLALHCMLHASALYCECNCCIYLRKRTFLVQQEVLAFCSKKNKVSNSQIYIYFFCSFALFFSWKIDTPNNNHIRACVCVVHRFWLVHTFWDKHTFYCWHMKIYEKLWITWMLIKPLVLCISPRRADMREDFPEPTAPTTATNRPGLTSRDTLKNMHKGKCGQCCNK